MSFAFIEAEKASFPIQRMCHVLGVSQSGFFAWRDRPACHRQRQDMIHLAHIRTAFALSNGTYGSPRMHRDLLDEGHQIGRHRTARPLSADCFAIACRATDEREQAGGPPEAPVQAHDRQRACLADRAQPCCTGLLGGSP